MKKIGPEAAVLHHLSQVLVGRRDDADVDRRIFPGPNAEKTLFLQHAQDLGLHIGTQLADFVEKKRTTLRCKEKTAVIVAGASERSSDMAEKLAFRDTGIDGRAIDCNQRALTSLWVKGVERRGKKLLTCSGLPSDQHRQITQLAHADNLAKRLHQRFALPYYAVRICQVSNSAFFVASVAQAGKQISECGQQNFLEIGTLAVQQVAGPGEKNSTPSAHGPSCCPEFMRNHA